MNALSLLDTVLNGNNYGLACFPELASPSSMPAVDVIQADKSYTISMDLPGMTENDVDINLKDNRLTISSVKKAEETKSEDNENKTVYLLRERHNVGQFTRTFTLPKDADSENINAKFNNGVLVITIGQKAEEQPRKITINVA